MKHWYYCTALLLAGCKDPLPPAKGERISRAANNYNKNEHVNRSESGPDCHCKERGRRNYDADWEVLIINISAAEESTTLYMRQAASA